MIIYNKEVIILFLKKSLILFEIVVVFLLVIRGLFLICLAFPRRHRRRFLLFVSKRRLLLTILVTPIIHRLATTLLSVRVAMIVILILFGLVLFASGRPIREARSSALAALFREIPLFRERWYVVHVTQIAAPVAL